MAHRLIAVGVMLAISVACSTPRVIRLDTGAGTSVEHRPPTSGGSLEVDADDFEEALAQLVLELPLTIRPSADERLVLASSTSDATGGPAPNFVRRAFEALCVGQLPRAHCLSLLDEAVGTLDDREKMGVALAFSLEPMRESIAEAVKETLSPRFFYAVVVTSMVTWAILAANPEPVFTKGAALVTALMLIYLGVDAVIEMAKASFALLQATRKASTLAELERAGERFGNVMGEQGARLFILAATAVAGRGAMGASSWLASRLPLMPKVAEASALGAAQLGILLRSVDQVRAMAISTEGVISITLGQGAVASLAYSTGRGNSSGPGEKEGAGGLKNVYDGITQAPGYPPRFKNIQNGTVKIPVHNKDLLKKLRELEPGDWQKIYRDGWVDGNKVSLHYFESRSGKVFDFKVKHEWSNQ